MVPKKKKRFYDYSLLFVIIFLTVFGLIMIYSASSYTAQLKMDDAGYYLWRQAKIAGAGFVLMIIVSFIDYHKYTYAILFLYPGSILLMIYTMLFGIEINGKRRWLSLGSLPSFQPTELVKVALILTLAYLVVMLGRRINSWKGLLILFAVDLLPAMLVAANNLSSGIIIVMLAVVMSFVATDNRWNWIYAAAMGAVVLMVLFIEPISNALASMGLLKQYQLSRILVWLEPEAHPLDGGYQVLQGLYAIGSGGFWGKGLGQSIQKMGFVPEAQNDMIFSIICEELGLFGAICLILVFAFLIYRLVVLSMSAPDRFGSYICIGVLAHVAIQVILNIAVVCNAIPNTGVTLPFISYGGTSVILLMLEMGMVLSVSRGIRLDAEQGIPRNNELSDHDQPERWQGHGR